MLVYLEYAVALIISLFTLLLCLELILGSVISLLGRPSSAAVSNIKSTQSKSVVLIPAHNEEQDIGATIAHLKLTSAPNDLILVVADNCTDNTAAVCANLGATVLERSSNTERGKGYALDFGAKWALANVDFDTLVLFDADCRFAPESFGRLVKQSVNQQSICQACYLMQAAPGDAKAKVAEFTWWLKNGIRATALNALGIGTHIQGSGIAFPRAILAQVNFASGSIVEDLELGLKLSIDKNHVLFAPHSIVTSHFPTNQEGLQEQRKRWEHGHLDTVLKFPSFLFKAIKNKSVRAIFLILDATIPPLFAFLILQVLVLIGGALLGFFDHFILLNYSLINLSALILCLIFAWVLQGYKILTLKDIPKIVKFFWDKISIYFSFVTNKQTTWVRTKRDVNTDEENKN